MDGAASQCSEDRTGLLAGARDVQGPGKGIDPAGGVTAPVLRPARRSGPVRRVAPSHGSACAATGGASGHGSTMRLWRPSWGLGLGPLRRSEGPAGPEARDLRSRSRRGGHDGTRSRSPAVTKHAEKDPELAPGDSLVVELRAARGRGAGPLSRGLGSRPTGGPWHGAASGRHGADREPAGRRRLGPGEAAGRDRAERAMRPPALGSP
jgi:hypothetical protein